MKIVLSKIHSFFKKLSIMPRMHSTKTKIMVKYEHSYRIDEFVNINVNILIFYKLFTNNSYLRMMVSKIISQNIIVNKIMWSNNSIFYKIKSSKTYHPRLLNGISSLVVNVNHDHINH